MSVVTASDRALLTEALAIGATARGRARPNPTVGCVVADASGAIGRGASDPVGGPHAEVGALAEAAARARGATLAVTLEPCAHHGRTPPCVDAIVAAGVTRVVVGVRDPHPRAGGGVERLRAVGIDVVGPLDEDDPLARAIVAELADFLVPIVAGRPEVVLKVACHADGSMVATQGRWITGEAARADVHRRRAHADAVLVGVGTVLTDDPRLDARDVAAVLQPRPVVLDAHARTPLDAHVVRPGTIVVVAHGAPAERIAALEARGVEVLAVSASADGTGVDLGEALRALAGSGITSVLAEPGARVGEALRRAGLVDRLVVHVAGDATPADVVLPSDVADWDLVHVGRLGDDLALELVPPNASRAVLGSQRAVA